MPPKALAKIFAKKAGGAAAVTTSTLGTARVEESSASPVKPSTSEATPAAAVRETSEWDDGSEAPVVASVNVTGVKVADAWGTSKLAAASDEEEIKKKIAAKQNKEELLSVIKKHKKGQGAAAAAAPAAAPVAAPPVTLTWRERQLQRKAGGGASAGAGSASVSVTDEAQFPRLGGSKAPAASAAETVLANNCWKAVAIDDEVEEEAEVAEEEDEGPVEDLSFVGVPDADIEAGADPALSDTDFRRKVDDLVKAMLRNSDLTDIIAEIKRLGGPVHKRELIATRMLEMGIDGTPSDMIAVDAAFIKLLKGKAIGVDSVIKGVAICLEPEFFDAFMKDSKQAATYFANMLRSLVRRQVLPGWYLPDAVAIILDVDNSYPEGEGEEEAYGAAVADYSEDEIDEDEHADWYEYGGTGGRSKQSNKVAKK